MQEITMKMTTTTILTKGVYCDVTSMAPLADSVRRSVVTLMVMMTSMTTTTMMMTITMSMMIMSAQ